MFQTVSLFSVLCPWETAVSNVVSILTGAGFEVTLSFDLQTARSQQAGISCPHHGINPCTCQMLVLLIYGSTASFISLVAQGIDRQTFFSLAISQGEDTALEHQVRQLLINNILEVNHTPNL